MGEGEGVRVRVRVSPFFASIPQKRLILMLR